MRCCVRFFMGLKQPFLLVFFFFVSLEEVALKQDFWLWNWENSGEFFYLKRKGSINDVPYNGRVISIILFKLV